MSQKTIETKNQSLYLPTPSTEHKQLGVWVGKWNTEGLTLLGWLITPYLSPSSAKFSSQLEGD